MADISTEEFASVLLEHVASQFEVQYQRKSFYNKNCVLTGCIDCYCLCCDEVLKAEEDVDGHIKTNNHKENLDKYPYVEVLVSDCIRKINKRYYCEYCNKILATMPKIHLHVKQQSHITNKSVGFDSEIKRTLFMTRVQGEVIAFDSLLIKDLAWNGIIDSNCLICDEELTDVDAHKHDVVHVINMIQSKIVEVGAINLIRQVDESMCQCLTCNKLIASNEMNTHFDESEHMILHTACQVAKHNYFEKLLDEDTLEIIEEPVSAENLGRYKMLKEGMTPQEEADKKKKTDADVIANMDGTKFEIGSEISQIIITKIQDPTPGLRKHSQEKQGISKKRQKKGKSNEDEEEFVFSPPKNIHYKTDYERLLCEPYGLENFIFSCHDDNRTFCLLCDWNKYNILDETLQNHLLGYQHRVLLDMENNRLQETKMGPKAVPSKNSKKKEKKQQLKKKEIHTPEKVDPKKNKVDGQEKSIDKKEAKEEIEIFVSSKTDEKFDSTNKEDKNSLTLADDMKDLEMTDTTDANSSFENVQIDNEKTDLCDLASKFGDVTETVLIIDALKRIETLEEKFSQFNLLEDYRKSLRDKEIENKDSETSCKVEHVEIHSEVHKESEISQKVLEFAEENLVAFNSDLKEFFCTVCGNKVSAVLRKMQRHVAKHEKIEERPSSPLHYQTMPFEEFVEIITCVDNLSRHDTVINNEICVNVLNFHMMKKQDGGIRCLVCNDLSISQMTEHINSDKHKSAVSNTSLLYTVQNEFIRELREGVYHCGFCNVFETGYTKLEQHLKTSAHFAMREKSEHALVSYMFETEMEYDHYKIIIKKELGDFMAMMQVLSEYLSLSQ